MPITSGIKELDAILGDGFARGTLCAVTGPPGAGTGIFAKQFAAAGDEKSYYFSTSESTEEVIETLKRFGWRSDVKIVDIADKYYDKFLLKRLEVTRFRQEGLRISDIANYEDEMYTEFNFLTYLTNEIFRITPPFRVVVDSLDFFIDSYGVDEVLSTLRTLKAFNGRNRGLLVVTLTRGVFDARTQNSIDALVDTLIELERERVGKKFDNNLIASKVKNYPERSRILQYFIGQNGIALME